MADYRKGNPLAGLAEMINAGNQGAQVAYENANADARIRQQRQMPAIEEASQEKLKTFMAGQQKEQQERELQQAVDTANKINSGRGMFGARASVKIGDTSVTEQAPGQGQYMGQMSKEATAARKYADGQLKPFQDQFDAAKNTLDNLDLNTPQGFKLALISEAKLAAGAGGSRALKSIIDVVTGGKTANMQFGDALNFVNNTADLTTPPAVVQNLREAVMNRVSQIQPNYQKMKQKITTDIPQMARMTDALGSSKTLIDNSFGTIDSTVDELNKRNTSYMQSKISQGQPGGSPPQAGYQQPQSNWDKLKSLFNPQAAQTPKQQAPASQSPSGNIRIRHKQSGQVFEGPAGGTIPPDYEQVQ